MGVPTSLEYHHNPGGTLPVINNWCDIGRSIERCAYCSLGQFHLVQAMPTDLLRHCFSFLTIMEYICDASLVCKQWHKIIHIDINDVRELQTIKFAAMRNIIYNTCKVYLPFTKLSEYNYYVLSPSKSDLLYEFELNTSFASLYTEQHEHHIVATYAGDVLFFDIDKTSKRKLSYSYLLNYVYLFAAETNQLNFDKMHSMLTRLLFTGSTLCIGYMIDLFLCKYGLCKDFGDRFWNCFVDLFENFYLEHSNNIHLNNKDLFVLYGSAFIMLHNILYYTRQLNCLPIEYWHWLMQQSPDNILNDLIICVLDKIDDRERVNDSVSFFSHYTD